jgi:hypothetical protein
MTPPLDGFVRPSASHTTQHILLAVVGSLAIYIVCGLCVMVWDALFHHTDRSKLETVVESLPSPAGANPKPSSPDKGASPAACPRTKTFRPYEDSRRPPHAHSTHARFERAHAGVEGRTGFPAGATGPLGGTRSAIW